MNLSGVAAIVTGGASGLGAETARTLARAGAKVTVEGFEKIDPAKNYVFCPNHLSYMDTPVILTHIRLPFRFLAKTAPRQ